MFKKFRSRELSDVGIELGSKPSEASTDKLSKLLPRGYAWYAAWIAEDKDNEGDEYRVFRRLTTRTLLYRQSELIELEAALAWQDDKDAHSQREKEPKFVKKLENLTCRWPWAKEDAEFIKETYAKMPSSPPFRAVGLLQAIDSREELIQKIDSKLKEYHELLILQNTVFNLEVPEQRVVEALRKQLHRSPRHIQGNAFDYLDDKRDLVALRKPPEADPLTKLVRTHAGVFGGLFKKPDTASTHKDLQDGHELGPSSRYSERRIDLATAFISTLSATVLLFGSILGLHYITNELARLLVVVVFTGVFAILVKFTTTAARSEVFAGSAAFAAVLVVYVGGALSTAK